MSFLLDNFDKNAAPYTEKGMKIGDIFANGGKWFLLGMVTVFAVLGLIWLCIEIFHLCMTPRKNTQETPAATPTRAPAPVVSKPEISAPVVTVSNDEEIVAVIAAAIEAAKTEVPNGMFRVVSFRRK